MIPRGDPLSAARAARVRDLVADLDQVGTGLRDLEAEPALKDHPDLQSELHDYRGVVRLAADLLYQLWDGHR